MQGTLAGKKISLFTVILEWRKLDFCHIKPASQTSKIKSCNTQHLVTTVGRKILSEEAFSCAYVAWCPPVRRLSTSSAAPAAYCKNKKREHSTTVTKIEFPNFFIAMFNLCFFNHMHSRRKEMCFNNFSGSKQCTFLARNHAISWKQTIRPNIFNF